MIICERHSCDLFCFRFLLLAFYLICGQWRPVSKNFIQSVQCLTLAKPALLPKIELTAFEGNKSRWISYHVVNMPRHITTVFRGSGCKSYYGIRTSLRDIQPKIQFKCKYTKHLLPDQICVASLYAEFYGIYYTRSFILSTSTRYFMLRCVTIIINNKY